jgi:hypothetical protein
MAAAVRRFGRTVHQLTGFRQAAASREAKAICPVDAWAFRPQYTEGRCPLCGWEAPGVVVRLPVSRRIDFFGWMALGMILLSVAMAVIVAVIYARA